MPPEQDPARRLSSRAVKIGMVSALSLTLVACSSKSTTAWCVDRGSSGGFTNTKSGYRSVPDSYCNRSDIDNGTVGYGRYFWYYGGRRGSNGFVTGGSVRGPSGGKIKSGSGRTLSRGGFGGHGKSGS
ncbi:hypothetical protein BTM25_30230 [Actinomadura rubteroloni]|uniref:Uncharacterized protein n=1 Tax=Actinomadura rubteroloni TaxID=1926885 RepID=A0A2P4UH52_9ACTN|nr:hypothetical protein [Actinomadura rubteroloni]POM24394.1 hypothetical protein BTM25_30230 [Actinomadura rubteroloni]